METGAAISLRGLDACEKKAETVPTRTRVGTDVSALLLDVNWQGDTCRNTRGSASYCREQPAAGCVHARIASGVIDRCRGNSNRRGHARAGIHGRRNHEAVLGSNPNHRLAVHCLTTGVSIVEVRSARAGSAGIPDLRNAERGIPAHRNEISRGRQELDSIVVGVQVLADHSTGVIHDRQPAS